ncbi:sulfatase family protein [Nocardioides pelophilus]|uniref:sulfatase family protein n=1 Tax=Nocardioides pelophilus TaxID=2172019 RepID=UPI001603A093|nr:sulfatase [Nocardioides pelophilus]
MRRVVGLVAGLLAMVVAFGQAPPSVGERAAEPSASAAAPGRPNVLFIMVDDMRDDDLRFMPQVRALIRDQGVRFRNSFSPYPLCCPARASVLSGRYTHNHGVYTVYEDYGFHAFDDRRTLATMLQDAGYANVYLGKYLNRYGFDPPPRAQQGNSLRYVPPGWDMWRASLDGGFAPGSPNAGSTYAYYDTTLSFNGKTFETLAGRYQTVAYGEIAGNIVRNRAPSPQPFLLYLSFTAPHSGGPKEDDDPRPTRLSNGELYDWKTPARPPSVWGSLDSVVLEAPGASWRDPDFSDKPGYLRVLPPLRPSDHRALLEVTRQRAEALKVVDQQVGNLMRTLADTGELDQTLVIFTSDNGYFLGEQRMRLGKVFPHEVSLRVPLLMRGPGIPAGETRTDPFTSVDFLPTIAAATGTTPDHRVDGVSMWRVARRGDVGWTRGILTETGALGHPPRNTNEAGEPLSSGGRRDIRFLLGIRTHRYLFVDVAHQRDELYDLRRDPREYRNLIDVPRYAAVRRSLRRALADIRACRGRACSTALPPRLQWPPA